MVDTRRTKSNTTTTGPSHGFVVETSLQPHGTTAASTLQQPHGALQTAGGVAEQPPHGPVTSTALQSQAPTAGAAQPRHPAGIAGQPPHGPVTSTALQSQAPTAGAAQPRHPAGIAEQPIHGPVTSIALQPQALVAGAALPYHPAFGTQQQPHHAAARFAAQPHGYFDAITALEQIHSLPPLQPHLTYAHVYTFNGALAHMPLAPMHTSLPDQCSQVDLNLRVDQLTQRVDDQNNLIGQLLRQINLNQGPNLGPRDEERRTPEHTGEQFERS